MLSGCRKYNVAVLFTLVCCVGSVFAAEKFVQYPQRTAISGVPWKPKVHVDNKVIYGTDDRHDVYEETDPERRAWADSTCALIGANDLDDNGDDTFSVDVSAYQVFGLPACDDEPYGNQPVAAFCTGFVVGPDLIATAGHCVDSFDLANTRFVFGFRMLDATTPKTTFDASEIYTGVEIIVDQLEGNFDYAIVRVDRVIDAPGAQVLPLRSAGTISEGTQVGVIGHPSGLPTKIAFGDATMVRDSSDPGFFVANLDTYGGNSGSPVFNAETGVVEGILVRGEIDFDVFSECFRSRNFPNDGGDGEDVSKASTFANFVQLGRGTIALDKSAYQCMDTVKITLFDHDLLDVGTTTVTLISSGSDFETVTLQESDTFGTFVGTIAIGSGAIESNSGRLEIVEGETIIATYRDENVGTGTPGDAVATARVDCAVPTISDVELTFVGGTSARISFTTNEAAIGMVEVGVDCLSTSITGTGALATEHEISVRNLAPLTDYVFRVSAADPAGNTVADDNGGACYALRTIDQLDYFTETFFDEATDVANRTVTFLPDSSASGYTACIMPAAGFPTTPFCGEPLFLGDDEFVGHILQGGRMVTLYGEHYDRFFVGSNGYITFGEGDTTYEVSLDAHFALPRISGAFSDLLPSAGGAISVAELEDRVAVSYYNVGDYFGQTQSFQIEMFYDGTIRITWIALTFPNAVVGLSSGFGLPEDFEESDLNTYPDCGDLPYPNIECDSGLMNDACSEAIPLVLDQVQTGSTAFAVSSNDLPGCEDCGGQDVWFSFTPSETGVYTVSLCGSDFDTILELYGGRCDNLVLVAGNDDSICEFQSQAVADLSANTTYLIRISGFASTSGNYEVTVTSDGKAGMGCHSSALAASTWRGDLFLMSALLAILLVSVRCHAS